MDKFSATITIHEDFCDKLFYYHNFNMSKYHSKRWCTTMEAGKRLRTFSPCLIKEARVFLPLSPFRWKYRVHLRDIFVPGKRQVSPEAGQWLHFLELESQWDYLFIGGQWRLRPAEWTVTCIRELKSRMIDHHAFLFWEQESVQVEEGHRLRLEYIRGCCTFIPCFSFFLLLFSRGAQRLKKAPASVGSLLWDGVDADGDVDRGGCKKFSKFQRVLRL